MASKVRRSGAASGVAADDALRVAVAGQVADKIAGFRRRYDWRAATAGVTADGEHVRMHDWRPVALAVEELLRRRWAAVEALAGALLAGVEERGHGKVEGGAAASSPRCGA